MNAPSPGLSGNAQLYLDALLAGDRVSASRIVHTCLHDGDSVIQLYEQVIQPALYRVGELWEHNQISVAAEHMATAISEGVMNELYGGIISPNRIGKTALIASVEKELHQVGAKMVSDLFEMHGWDTIFLGANTPIDELLRMVRDHPAQLIGLSLSVYFHLPELEQMIDRFRGEYPDIPILIGGQGLRNVGKQVALEREGVHFYSNLTDLDRHMTELSGT
jgi:methanogenic corrinoid protein MtbC1